MNPLTNVGKFINSLNIIIVSQKFYYLEVYLGDLQRTSSEEIETIASSFGSAPVV